MKDTNLFQVVVIGVFLLLAVVGVIFFAGFGGFGSSGGQIGPVTIWGTAERNVVDGVLGTVRLANDNVDFDGVRYERQNPDTYFETLVNAIAAGTGPDLFFLSDADVLRMEDKIQVIPFDTYTERLFAETFVEGAEIFLRPDGVLALPLSVDPMVMYWNRTLFSNAGVARPPKGWEEVFSLTGKLTLRDGAGNITQSTLAFGEFDNVTHAKQILLTLVGQAGSPLVTRGPQGGGQVVLGAAVGGENALEAGLRFFTEFSNPAKSTYSWNSALPSSRNAFLAGDLALYPGFASELPSLRAANPNLNFALTPLPQASSARSETAGRFLGLAIPNGANNPAGALRLALFLTGADGVTAYAQAAGLPPVRRDLLSEAPVEAIDSVFYEAALTARTFLDPDPARTSAILRTAVRDITSGRSRIAEAAAIVDRELQNLFR